MSRSRSSWLLAVLLIYHANVTFGLHYDCSYVNNANWCTIANLSIASEQDYHKATFPNVSLIYLNQPHLDYLSPTLLRQMIAVDKMEIDGGRVPKIYIKPSLSRISAHKNQVVEVIIDPEDNYSLEHLGIAYNQIREVPKNINRLRGLVRLHLHDNQIQVVNMDQFKDLNRLKVLALHRNGILRIDTTIPIKLINLEEFFLYGNQLEDLFVNLWDFPNLGTLHLASNRFRSINRFPEQFAALAMSSLGGNSWNCAWLVRTLGRIAKQDKPKVSGDKQCLGNKVAGICCEGAPDDMVLYLMQSAGDLFQRMNVWMIRQEREIEGLREAVGALKSERMESRIRDDRRFSGIEEQVESLKDGADFDFDQVRRDLQRIESNSPKQVLEKFEWFTSRLNENRAMIDDVIQDLYLAELEKL
uniref:Leucine-rich repeat transmembrane neuronal protein 1 n=1 Tax=Culex pipiens TaxID=7175 RepID=A0A8D8CSX3_CULPI